MNVLRASKTLLLLVCLFTLSLPCLSRAEVNPAATALAWSPDSKTLAVGGQQGVTLYTHDLVQTARLLDTRSDISALGWSSDGTKLAAGRYDGLIRVWDVAACKLLFTLRGHLGAVNAIVWGANDTQIATGGDDLSVRVWDVKDAVGTQIAILDKHRDRVYTLAWGASVPVLISGGADNAVWLWQQSDWNALPSPQYHTRAVYALAWNADGSIYASGSADRSVRLGQANGSSLGGFTGHTNRVIALAWRPDGTLLSVSWDHTIRQWTQGTREGKILSDSLPDKVAVVAFSPDTQHYALIDAEGNLLVQALP